MEPEGPQTGQNDKQGAPESNVVRLPLDWLGPREELVPFGPGADEADAPSAKRTEPGAAPSVHDFWGEDSAAMHDAVQGPSSGLGESQSRAERGAAERGAAIRRTRDWPAAHAGSSWLSRTASLIAVGALGIAVLVVVVQAVSGGTGSRGARRAARAEQPTLSARRSASKAGLFPSRHFVARLPARSHSGKRREVRRPAANLHAAAPQPPAGSVASAAPAADAAGYTADVPATAPVQPTSSSTSSGAAAPSAAQSSGSASPPTFGLGGSLGPGHSPNG